MLIHLIKAVRVVGLSYKLVSTSLLLSALVAGTLQRQRELPKEPLHHEFPRHRKR